MFFLIGMHIGKGLRFFYKHMFLSQLEAKETGESEACLNLAEASLLLAQQNEAGASDVLAAKQRFVQETASKGTSTQLDVGSIPPTDDFSQQIDRLSGDADRSPSTAA